LTDFLNKALSSTQQVVFFLFPDAACPIVGQVTTSCASACPPDCLIPPDANLGCPTVCATCECSGDDEVVDYITGKCVQQERCTGKLETYITGMLDPAYSLYFTCVMVYAQQLKFRLRQY